MMGDSDIIYYHPEGRWDGNAAYLYEKYSLKKANSGVFTCVVHLKVLRG